MYEWYIYALSDDVDGEAAETGRRALSLVLEDLAPRRTSDSSSSVRPDSDVISDAIRFFNAHLQSSVRSKWERIGKPGVRFGLRFAQALTAPISAWGSAFTALGAAALAVEEGHLDEIGEFFSQVIRMEKPCSECKTVTMIDDESRLCYDCWCELDILDHEKENEHVREQYYTEVSIVYNMGKKPCWIEITWCTVCHSKVWNGLYCKCMESLDYAERHGDCCNQNL